MKSLAEENWAYYEGDTFQFWTGPKPPLTHPKYPQVMSHLKSIFHSYNIIKEGVHHYRDALVGLPFNWYLKLGGEKAKDASETEKMLQSWWDWQKRLAISQGSSQGSAIAAAVVQTLCRDDGNGVGTGYLRLYQLKRYANSPQPWKQIALHAPKPGSVEIERDADDLLTKAIYRYGSNFREEYMLLDDGKCQVITFDGDEEQDRFITDLDGRLPIFELRSSCIIGEDAKQCQNSINKTLTMKGQNVNLGGFVQTVLTNAQMPGEWVEDANAPGGERFVPRPDALEIGPNKITFVQGIPLGDPRNPSGYTTPSVNYREPVNVTTFRDSIEIDLICFYRSVGLGHLLTVADGTLNGVSRETIKQDFITRLEGYAQAIEAVVADVVSVVLWLLADATGQQQLRDYEPVVELKLSTGKPLPEERQANRDDFNAGLRSRTTAMVASGIDDPDAEAELIKREKEEDIKRMPMPLFSSDQQFPPNQELPPTNNKQVSTNDK